MRARGLAMLALGLTAGCTQIFGLADPVHRGDAGGDDAADALAADASIDGTADATVPGKALHTILGDLALTGSLLVELDAGDSASYPGTGQTWNNTVTSATAVTHFYLGDSPGISGNDPTFHGTSGGLSPAEYFQFDGNDRFSETLSGWGDDNFHHSGAKVTIATVVWHVNGGTAINYLSNHRANDTNLVRPGVSFFRYNGSAGELGFYEKGDNSAFGGRNSTGSIPVGAWAFTAVAYEAKGSGYDITFAINDAVEQFSAVSAVYGVGDAEREATLGCLPNGNNPAPNGTRFAMVAIWSRNLSMQELGGLYEELQKTRFPTLP